MVICAYKNWEEVISFDDEASLMSGTLQLTNVPCAPDSPMTDISSGSKLLSSRKMGGYDYTQLNAAPSPDVMSSLYSVGSVSGLDDFTLHGIENMGLRFDQPMSYPSQVSDPMICDTDSFSFCDDEHLRFFDSDLTSQTLGLESQADLQSAVESFLARPTSLAIVGRAQTRWTKLFSVLRWFSIRRIVTTRKAHVR